MNSLWAPLPVAVPLLAAAALAIGNRTLSRMIADIFSIATSLFTTYACFHLLLLSRQDTIVYWFGGWQPRKGVAIGISFVIDPFGAGAAAFAAFLTVLALITAAHYFEAEGTIFHALMLCFLGAMCGFCLSGDVFNMFVFFELMGAAAFALCGYKNAEGCPIQGALNFAVTNSIGAFMVLSGIGLLYGRTGALNMAQIGRALGGNHDQLVLAAFAFIVCGFLVKAAVVPFQFWLADAHAVAPASVCMLLSGIMVELGLYAVARLYWTVFDAGLHNYAGRFRVVLFTAGVITALFGAVLCFAQRHLKRLLAYSTVSHMGLVLIGVAMLSPGALAGAAMYVLGHGAVKAGLFGGAGLLLHRLGSVDEMKLQGKAREIPGTVMVMGLCALSLAGLPLGGTFAGAALIHRGAESLGLGWSKYIFIFASALTAGAVLRVLGRAYFGWGPVPEGKPAKEGETDEEPETIGRRDQIPPSMSAPVLILVCFGFLVSFIPGGLAGVERQAVRFEDRAGSTARVLDQEALPRYAAKAVKPEGSDYVEGSVSSLCAIGAALLALFRDKLRFWKRLRVDRFFEKLVDPFRALESGHLGDYVAWLALGLGTFGGLFIWLAR